jgi:hypothetical protein
MTHRFRLRATLAVALAALAAAAGPAEGAAPREPRLDVRRSALRSALFCQASVTHAPRTPVLLVTGTGVDGSEGWPDGLQRSLVRAGIPSCYVDFPQHATADLQVSVQYLVDAIRTVRRRAGRDIAVYGISQGALLPRLAFTYWPSLRGKVSDAVLLAGTHHGTTVFSALASGCGATCRFTPPPGSRPPGRGCSPRSTGRAATRRPARRRGRRCARSPTRSCSPPGGRARRPHSPGRATS